MRRPLLLTLAAASCAALVLASPAAAHKGLFFTDTVRELTVGDGTTSYAAYGTLDPRHPTAALTMTLRKGDLLHVELLLPDRPTERALPRGRRPTLRVSWRGGSKLLRPVAKPTSFFEPFSRTRYLKLAALDRPAPVDGEYRLTVRGQRGRFVVAPGTVERFGASDLLEAPKVVKRVRDWYRSP
jgi:hypothetical protein